MKELFHFRSKDFFEKSEPRKLSLELMQDIYDAATRTEETNMKQDEKEADKRPGSVGIPKAPSHEKGTTRPSYEDPPADEPTEAEQRISLLKAAILILRRYVTKLGGVGAPMGLFGDEILAWLAKVDAMDALSDDPLFPPIFSPEDQARLDELEAESDRTDAEDDELERLKKKKELAEKAAKKEAEAAKKAPATLSPQKEARLAELKDKMNLTADEKDELADLVQEKKQREAEAKKKGEATKVK